MRLVRIFVFLLTALLLGNLNAATTGKITGVVTDANTGEPLPGANVIIDGTFMGAATDLEGFYVILNVPPGAYTLKAMMVGYATQSVEDVRVRIDQTTTINYKLSEEALDVGETITVVAKRPVVERDVAASRANISAEDIEALPVMEVSEVVGLQAGIQPGMVIRGSGSDEMAFVVDGITLRDERDNRPFTGISFSAIEEVQVQAGGFSAEYGNIRSGIVNVVTKEGGRNQYNVSLITRYSPAGAKHFGPSASDPNSFYLRPYLDPAVAFTGVKNGEPYEDLNANGAFDEGEPFTDLNGDNQRTFWDIHTRKQYANRDWEGFNALSEQLMTDDDPNNDLSPLALQELFLWEHRRQLEISEPDYDIDMSFGGPVPFVSEALGDLRFRTSYRRSRDMYLFPLNEDAYRDYTWQFKLTSDVGVGKKLSVETLVGRENGSSMYQSGRPGIIKSPGNLASRFYTNFSYAEGALYGTDYWSPSQVDYLSIGAKFTNAISDRTFYEASIHRFSSEYDTNPANFRDYTLIKEIGDGYFVDETPLGLEYFNSTSSIINGMRTGLAFSQARDSSRVTSYTARFDFTSQINRFNNIKTGVEFVATQSEVNYASLSPLEDSNSRTFWDRTPLRGAVYISDKLEFEGMVAQLGLRLDYSHAGDDWYANYSPYDSAFEASNSQNVDELVERETTKHIFTLSPRLAVAFPITENSKLYFNYGHFRQMPTPENLYLFERHPSQNTVEFIADPNNPLPKTVAYELGYEQSLFDQYLIRAAGYYKDVSLQPRSVRYEGLNQKVSYTTTEPKNYEDIRGFEITLRKNRGNWFRGFVNYTYMVSTSGNFGFSLYQENRVAQREYERLYRAHYQEKPVPRPYGRANIDFFTPAEYGPDVLGWKPFEEWRLNVLGSWQSGTHMVWYGPGSNPPGATFNLQWRDYWNINLRISRNFRFFGSNIELFVDINNAFNFKRLSSYGFDDANDRNDYYKSLHLPGDIEGFKEGQFSYTMIPGDDRPGDYRKTGVAYVPIIARGTYSSLAETELNDRDLYYFAEVSGDIHGKGYYRYQGMNEDGAPIFMREDQGRVNQILDDKAYIDMPNRGFLTFLNPRDIFWGLKLSFDF